MTEPILAVRGLRAVIHGDGGVARILDHVDFSVPRGRIVALVGESGCGKTTLLRAILGILPARGVIEAGSIRFEGHDLVTLTERQMQRDVRGAGIGFVPQDPYLALNPVFTVGTQLLAGLRAHSVTPRAGHRAHLVDILRRLRLPDPASMLDRYPHQLSGGQRQRLLIGGALAMGPRLIIADEPTTALDAITQRQILALLRSLARDMALSMVFVTHDLGAAAQLCDEICVMYAGQLVESGPAAAVLRSPKHPYTAALLACHPERSSRLTGIAGSVPSPTNAPPGCRFAPRCGSALPGCRKPDPCSARGGRWAVGRLPAVRRMSAEPLLQARQVSVRLGTTQAVREVSLSLQQGEILALAGESGSGKTTLARTLLGIQRESAGQILLHGREVSRLDPTHARKARRDIQYVHQDAAATLDPWWRIGASLHETLALHGIRDRRQRDTRIAELLLLVGLDPAIGSRYAHELSGGQLRRVALARILVLEPRIVILDEPTAGLDTSVQATILTLLAELQARLGLTYLIISHDLGLISRFCHRVAIFHHGRIVEAAPAATLFANPLHPYTRALLAATLGLEPGTALDDVTVDEVPPAATTGCAFRLRCPEAVERCATHVPPLEPAGTHRHSACWRWRDLAPWH